MESAGRRLLYLLVFVLGFLCGYCVRNAIYKPPRAKEIVKTINYSIAEKYVFKTPKITSCNLVRIDTIEHVTEKHDTIYVPLPIETKEFRDSLYYARVSGYKPSLDYIEVFGRTNYVVTEKSIYIQPKKLSVGVGVGPGLLLSPNGNVHAGLGVTVGLQYRF